MPTSRKISVTYRDNPLLSDAGLNALFSASWPDHKPRKFGEVLDRSLGYVAAFDGGELVGFVNVASDGGAHAFVLDPTVAPAYRRRGVGTELVQRARKLAEAAGCEWLHVDFAPELESFYRASGFRPTAAGIIALIPRSGSA